ncbi:DUF4142 domain-containing protein [Streptomyces sp. CRN 30]|uniref:DUF4142 domain-containing protein n=1 Tax=Streptomyces sp. CRN 30 TaxID=3075613 RepID=UPI002A840B2D|nr:DUF4142 domain-containing protein [Streptomyces sp. CRN 30]
MRMTRSRIGVVVLFGVLSLTLTALAFPSMVGLQKKDGGQDRLVASTPYGPLTEADRDFVVKVRAAGLWEYPLGELAMERGTSKAMKEAGEHLVVGHAGLDAECRKISTEMGITLPNKASPQQQEFVATVAAKKGADFDATAVTIMRVTHGQIFPVIANIRATTRNTMVRELADLANDTVLDHMTVLEKTGLVGFGDVSFKQTAPAKLPNDRVTPPPPGPGEPTAVLTPRPDLDVKTGGPAPSVSATAAPTAASTTAG